MSGHMSDVARALVLGVRLADAEKAAAEKSAQSEFWHRWGDRLQRDVLEWIDAEITKTESGEYDYIPASITAENGPLGRGKEVERGKVVEAHRREIREILTELRDLVSDR